MISLLKGDRFRNTLTGKVFAVKMIGDRMIVLESDDRSDQVLTVRDNLKLFYEKIGEGFQPEAAG